MLKVFSSNSYCNNCSYIWMIKNTLKHLNSTKIPFKCIRGDLVCLVLSKPLFLLDYIKWENPKIPKRF